jgi:YbbR domain-containing protein
MASILGTVAANWKLKTLAFALAVLLWIVVSAEQVTTNWFTVPLEVQVNDPNYQVMPLEIREVQVRFSGAARDLLEVAARRPPLRLVIGQVEGDAGSYELHPRMVQLTGQIGVSALDVRPVSVPVNFTRVDSRVVPVRPRVTEVIGPEWAVVDTLALQPDQVRVTGPATRIAAISEVHTQPFEITSADTLFERTIPIDTTGLQGLELSTRSVTAAARIDRLVERTIPNVPVDVGPGVRVVPDRVEVRLRGPERIVQAISPAFFRVVVSIDQIPAVIPPDGAAVPLRVDRVRAGVQAAPNPGVVRLFTIPPPVDTIPGPMPLEEPDTVPADSDDA